MATDTRLPGDTRRGVPARPVPPRSLGSGRPAPGRATPRTAPGRGPDPRTPSVPRNPVTAPRHTRPVTGLVPRPVPAAGDRPRGRSPRMPFILLLVGLLGGALVSLLVISTTLAQGAFRITNLQQQNANLARQQQILANEVAQAANPATIAKEAGQLGMRPNPRLGFVDLKSGKIVTGKPSSAEAAIQVPGYTP
jgi:hypothetical protein